MTTYAIPTRRLDLALMLLRTVVGAVFILHGWQKLFVLGFEGVTGGFTQMSIPAPEIVARVVPLVEFFGGILLVMGLFTRLAAFLLAMDMLAATMLVHYQAGFFLPNGYEFTLTLMGASLAVMLAGPGSFSLDAWLKSRRGTWAPAEGPITVTRYA
ncbi:MAG TPA: DoxX family protein [Gemmatimonadaceae bacterium]|nr:DoxX family protein [Gemmatimonadaceae bacterium]